MAREQSKLAERFSAFFEQLLVAEVDYHIGVVTTDPRDLGVLERYDREPVEGCSACRVLTNDVPREDAQTVFSRLVSVGTDGGAFEDGFAMAARALGGAVVGPDGLPTGEVPEENEGFLREDASLFIIFVSDEDEGAGQDGTPVSYYQRLFEDLKGRGNEGVVSVSSIVGWPTEAIPANEICASLQVDDARRAEILETMRAGGECFDEAGEGDDDDTARTGGRYIELACATGGVVANLCEGDYTVALDGLGANAAGLKRIFPLSIPDNVDFGIDGLPFTDDDGLRALDCDGDENSSGPLDAVICVRATPLSGDEEVLVANDPVNGFNYDPQTTSLRFDGAFIPKPGTDVFVSYRRFETASQSANP